MDDPTFTIHIDLPVDLDEAWQLVTDPVSLGDWWAATVDLDAEPGADGTVRFRDDVAPDGVREASVVVVEEVVPQERFAFRWASPTRPPTTVVFDLVPLVDATRIVITERPVPQGLAAMRLRACAAA